MTNSDRLLRDIKNAVNDLDVYPGKLVMSLFRNELRPAVQCALEEGLTLVDIDNGIRFIGSRVAINKVNAVLNRWKKV